MKSKTGNANVIFSDYPDLDVIRVDNVYYMVSTTMHFFPGCVILRSYNLIDWEIASYVYDELDGTEGQRLLNNNGVYGNGMWAASLRYNKGKFYVAFVANDTHKTYLYTSDKIEGPWKKSEIEGFYHDLSLLFDGDRAFIVSGNSQIRLLELNEDLTGPKAGGIDKIIVQEKDDVILGYEGSHFYKINGKYYLFFIHWPKGKLRTEACYVSDSIDGPYTGGDVLCADFKNWASGCAQGGVVDTPDGNWYAMLFQDHGALGRMPVLVSVDFSKEFPVFTGAAENNGVGKAEEKISVVDLNSSYKYEPLFCNDFLDKNGKLNKCWQWNHQPDLSFTKLTRESFSLKTSRRCKNPLLCQNTLTQRAFTESCGCTVSLDFSDIKDGDFAGVLALEGDYGFIAATKEQGKNFLVYGERASEVQPFKIGSVDEDSPKIVNKIEIDSNEIEFKVEFILHKECQKADFYYFDTKSKGYISVGSKKLRFTLDQFCGVRFGLFNYSTLTFGGTATFSDFKYILN